MIPENFWLQPANGFDKNSKGLDIESIEKKEIKGFNNNKSGWRNYPLSVSRPIISNDGKMVLITIIRGNSGGSTELYKMENGKWEYFEHLERWAY